MIAIGSDHAGVRIKSVIISHLEERGFVCRNVGTDSDESVDYPDIAEKIANEITEKRCERGIAICGTGIGISIAANKINGIRAAVCSDVFSAVLSRRHNDSNILSLGARVLGDGAALMMIDAWLDAEFEGGGRHEERIRKIHALE